LRDGDAVLHTWNVLHGVDAGDAEERTSLIVWFVDEEEEWLSVGDETDGAEEDDDDDVSLFVAGCAMDQRDVPQSESEAPSVVMNLESSVTTLPAPGASSSSLDLYIRSAAKGNPFALTHLGILCQDYTSAATHISPAQLSRILEVLESLRPSHFSPFPLVVHDDQDPTSQTFAMTSDRLFYEGAMRGHAPAQLQLADSYMEMAMTIQSAPRAVKADLRLRAALLFALAAQQGNVAGAEALSRVVELEYRLSMEGSDEEEKEGDDGESENVEMSWVVMTARASMFAFLPSWSNGVGVGN